MERGCYLCGLLSLLIIRLSIRFFPFYPSLLHTLINVCMMQFSHIIYPTSFQLCRIKVEEWRGAAREKRRRRRCWRRWKKSGGEGGALSPFFCDASRSSSPASSTCTALASLSASGRLLLHHPNNYHNNYYNFNNYNYNQQHQCWWCRCCS